MSIDTNYRADPRKIFDDAHSFHLSYQLLLNSLDRIEVDDHNTALSLVAHPIFTLSAFASELYLKCLLAMEGKYGWGHDLKALFELLSIPAKRELDDLWDISIRQPDKQTVVDRLRQVSPDFRLDLRYALERGTNAFKESRYFYEAERVYNVLLDLPNLLETVITKRCPSWTATIPVPNNALII